jgi:hypothetical protein
MLVMLPASALKGVVPERLEAVDGQPETRSLVLRPFELDEMK